MTDYILEIKDISKSFPGVRALDGVSLCIRKGSVHALMGENGAGKSTLMKILMGLLSPDTGEVYLNGKQVRFSSAYEALKSGLSMIHQELMPFPHLSIAENIYMGREPTTRVRGWINRRRMNEDATQLLKRLGSGLDASTPVNSLNAAGMQMVEIAKAISNNASVIIMDEPTSAISDREVLTLFKIIKELKQQGISIIYISHKMDEILEISDDITVMRDGKYIGTYNKTEVDKARLISLIVGRDIHDVFEKIPVQPGKILLSVQELTGLKFRDITFHVRSGEIVGLAGLMGSGRTEIVNAIFGLEKVMGGTVLIKGSKKKLKSPACAIRKGLGMVSEDRKNLGLLLKSSVKRNITLSGLRKITKGLFIDMKKENRIAAEQIKKFAIKVSSPGQNVNYLSGGNQQKVVLAKILLQNPDIIILDEPTKGIDVGAKTEIYRMIFQLAAQGKAIILISSELPEIIGMSDRILVVHNGTITRELGRTEATQELIMKYAML